MKKYLFVIVILFGAAGFYPQLKTGTYRNFGQSIYVSTEFRRLELKAKNIFSFSYNYQLNDYVIKGNWKEERDTLFFTFTTKNNEGKKVKGTKYLLIKNDTLIDPGEQGERFLWNYWGNYILKKNCSLCIKERYGLIDDFYIK